YDWGLNEDNLAVIKYYFWEYLGALGFIIMLSIWSLRIILRHREDTNKRLGTDWLFQFWLVSNFVILLWLIDTITDLTINLDLANWLSLALCLLFFWVSYRGVYQFRLAEDQFEIRSIRAEKEVLETHQEIIEPEGALNPYLARLQVLMDQEHLFRDPTINRDRIAEKLGISSGYFSQTFSAARQVNFSEYLNQLRVEDVKKMLVDPDFAQYSLVAIGLEAGFKSKSNFYSVFKRITGKTPTEFKKNALEQKRTSDTKPPSFQLGS
ncbi:MAG: helix-turn-helix domain-containing protein, partial [Bacteroidota bacterium]